MKLKPIFLSFTLLVSWLSLAQADCKDAIIVCGNTTFKDISTTGFGNIQERTKGDCVIGEPNIENNSIWLKIAINKGGTLGFDIIPESTKLVVDFDFAVFGPNKNCENLGDYIRSSYTNPNGARLSYNSTGLREVSTNICDSGGRDGNGYSNWLTVADGDIYYILIDRFEGASNFSIQWTGTAKFNTSPIFETTPLNLSNILGTTTINLEQNSALSIGTQQNLVATYHLNQNDAINNKNPIINSGNYSNISNPQTIFVRLTNTITGCFNTTSFAVSQNTKITPDFAQIGPICSGESVNPLPTISRNGISGTWLPVLDNSRTTTYTFTPTDLSKYNTTSMTIIVNPKVVPLFTQVSPICSGDVLTALPTTSSNNIRGVWTPALNNTATTTYTFTPSDSSCSTTTSMTIIVNPKVVPLFTQVSPICSGDVLTALPTTSTNNIRGVWTPALNNTATTTYTFTPNDSSCSTTATMKIEVITRKELKLSISQGVPFENDTEIVIKVEPSGDYLYQIDGGTFQDSPVFKNPKGCAHVVNVKEMCSSSSVSSMVLNYPRFFTPNNDGNNDYWNISCNEYKGSSIIYIFDRFGKLVNEIKPKDRGWDGKLNNVDLPADDYWFTFQYFINGQTQLYKGHFSLVR